MFHCPLFYYSAPNLPMREFAKPRVALPFKTIRQPIRLEKVNHEE
jgi:hypothetical protein